MSVNKRGIIIALAVIIIVLLTGIIILVQNNREMPELPPVPEVPHADTPAAERREMLTVRPNLLSVEFIPRDGMRYNIIIDRDSGSVYIDADNLIFRIMQSELEMLMFASVSLDSLICITENADDAQLSSFGFDNPRLIWQLHYDDGTSDVIEIGDNLPTGDGSYVKARGSKDVYYIGQVQTTLLLRPLEELYDISFLPIPPSTEDEPTWNYIAGVALDRNDELISFYKRTDDELIPMPIGTSSFVLKQPFETDCSDYMIQTVFLEPITHINPSSIVELSPSGLSQYGLDNPDRLTVNIPLQSNDNYTRTLLIGNYDVSAGGRYVMIEGYDAVLLDSSGNYDFLETDPFQLQAKIIWLHAISEVSSVNFELDGINRTLVLDHEGDTLSGRLDGAELSEDNTRRLYTSALSILASGGTDAGIPDILPEYVITINFRAGGNEIVELFRLSDSTFLIVHDGVSTNSYITRLALYQNLLSRFEILDAGGDLRRS